MREEAARLDELAAAVADGRVLNWDNLESSARDEDERSSIRRLRAIAAIGQARELADDAADSLSARSLLQGEDDPSHPNYLGNPSDPRPYQPRPLRRRLPRLGFEPRRELGLRCFPRPTIHRLGPRHRRGIARSSSRSRRADAEHHPVMEFVDGKTLAADLKECGPFPAEEVAQIGIALCGALSAVHLAGLVHRDVKAQNVLRDARGRVVLGDFGTGLRTRRGAPRAGGPGGYTDVSHTRDLHGLGGQRSKRRIQPRHPALSSRHGFVSNRRAIAA